MKNRFEQVRRYYLAGYWDARMLADAVTKGWISEEEYQEIVSEKRGDGAMLAEKAIGGDVG